MSSSVYRLEAPRPRPPPPPLRFHNPSPSSSLLTSDTTTQTLLYDLPSATSVSSPPTSPTSNSAAFTPSSPPYPGSRSRGRRNGRPGPTPSPSARNRSVTPLGVSRSELESFAEHCRAWYFDQNEASGAQMTQTLANLPPSQRAPFSRLQASIRSAYHASVNARKHAEFQAHLCATQPGGSLMPHSRADPKGPMAKKERLERFARFVGNWCTMGLPGTTPFFEALWAVMRLQVLPEHLGGAGSSRIQWEFDDAVFKEAAGKDFMLEAIDVLKGVLAFEEVVSPQSASGIGLYTVPESLSTLTQLRSLPSYIKPSELNAKSIESKPAPVAMAFQTKRARAPSDPFLDTPSPSRSFPAASSQSSSVTAVPTIAAISEAATDGTDATLLQEDEDGALPPLRSDFTVDDSEPSLRIWTAPDLPNPEYLSLLSVFPSFITRRSSPRFSSNQRAADIEEGDDERGEGREVRCGTGSIWIGSRSRSDGWKGDWWTRFLSWWRRLFC